MIQNLSPEGVTVGALFAVFAAVSLGFGWYVAAAIAGVGAAVFLAAAWKAKRHTEAAEP